MRAWIVGALGALLLASAAQAQGSLTGPSGCFVGVACAASSLALNGAPGTVGQGLTQNTTGTSPGWYVQLSTDTVARVRLGLNSTDVSSIAFGAGGAANRDLFIERAGAANLRLGAPDAAAPVAQTLSVQNVVAGTSNVAGAATTIAGSQGTGTGAGGSVIIQTAPAGTTGSAQNAEANSFTLDSTGTETLLGALTVGTFNTIRWTSRGVLSSPAANAVQIGGADAASPSAQLFECISVATGTSNTAGVDCTIGGSRGTGTGNGGKIILQTALPGSTGSAQNARSTGFSLDGVTGAITMPLLASSSAATTGTVCWTSGGNLTVDTTLACLASTRRIKQAVRPLTGGLAEVLALKPVSYDLKPQFNPKHLGRQVGLIAEDVQKVDPRLVGLDANGEVQGVRYMQMVGLLVSALQEENAQVKCLAARVQRLEHHEVVGGHC